MRDVRITITVDDRENNCMMQGEYTLAQYMDLENVQVDSMALIISEINEQIDKRLKEDKVRAHINLGQEYNIDLGASHPINVIPLEFMIDGTIKCEYTSSYPGRVEMLDIRYFNQFYGK